MSQQLQPQQSASTGSSQQYGSSIPVPQSGSQAYGQQQTSQQGQQGQQGRLQQGGQQYPSQQQGGQQPSTQQGGQQQPAPQLPAPNQQGFGWMSLVSLIPTVVDTVGKIANAVRGFSGMEPHQLEQTGAQGWGLDIGRTLSNLAPKLINLVDGILRSAQQGFAPQGMGQQGMSQQGTNQQGFAQPAQPQY
ncbi:hypothetical protein [Halorientalis pallida]|uniref:hypothetical protein n=1 Tax=Halorientalis pallida TaxID=2479928 RepID=UPI00187D2CAD|nr:hypothetical protein [Halorientalis pallida]